MLFCVILARLPFVWSALIVHCLQLRLHLVIVGLIISRLPLWGVACCLLEYTWELPGVQMGYFLHQMGSLLCCVLVQNLYSNYPNFQYLHFKQQLQHLTTPKTTQGQTQTPSHTLHPTTHSTPPKPDLKTSTVVVPCFLLFFSRAALSAVYVLKLTQNAY